MIYYLQTFSGLLSVVIAFAAAVVRVQKTEERFLPFLLLIGVAFLAEITGFVMAAKDEPTIVILNVYVLTEALLITWQFRCWGQFTQGRWPQLFYPALQASYAGLWLYESFISGRVDVPNSYFIVYSSLLIVLVSADMLTRQVVFGATPLKRNAVFLACLGFLFYFTSALLMEVFWLYGLQKSTYFRNLLLLSMACVNLFTNLLFAYAILWIPTKFQYLRLW